MKMRNLRDKYNSATTWGCYLPAFGGPMVTSLYLDRVSALLKFTFLLQVRAGAYWCPHTKPHANKNSGKQVDMRPCLKPPCKEKLFQILETLSDAQSSALDLGLDETGCPTEIGWCAP